MVKPQRVSVRHSDYRRQSDAADGGLQPWKGQRSSFSSRIWPALSCRRRHVRCERLQSHREPLVQFDRVRGVYLWAAAELMEAHVRWARAYGHSILYRRHHDAVSRWNGRERPAFPAAKLTAN